jgi:uncharacterized membrane protein YoaK (UPF0700 family)
MAGAAWDAASAGSGVKHEGHGDERSDRRRRRSATRAGTGVVDAVSILALGRVFIANMTGNVVFIGFALAGAPGFSLAASLLALAGFLIVLIAAAALGLQNATARELAVPDVTTTVLTLTLTGFAADLRQRNGQVLPRRLLAVGAMLAGASAGGRARAASKRELGAGAAARGRGVRGGMGVRATPGRLAGARTVTRPAAAWFRPTVVWLELTDLDEFEAERLEPGQDAVQRPPVQHAGEHGAAASPMRLSSRGTRTEPWRRGAR